MSNVRKVLSKTINPLDPRQRI